VGARATVFRCIIEEKTTQAIAVLVHFHKSDELSPFEDLLEAIGRSADKEAILQDARNQAAFDCLFAEETRRKRGTPSAFRSRGHAWIPIKIVQNVIRQTYRRSAFTSSSSTVGLRLESRPRVPWVRFERIRGSLRRCLGCDVRGSRGHQSLTCDRGLVRLWSWPD
jgi:hypothetical protein